MFTDILNMLTRKLNTYIFLFDLILKRKKYQKKKYFVNVKQRKLTFDVKQLRYKNKINVLYTLVLKENNVYSRIN